MRGRQFSIINFWDFDFPNNNNNNNSSNNNNNNNNRDNVNTYEDSVT